jgi:nitroreductase
MDIHQLISHRESIRSYDPARPVDPEILNRILEAGRLAPSACNLQPWEFLVVQSPEALARVRPCYGRPWFHAAPQILIVVGARDQAWVRKQDGYNSLETDLTIAMDHLILAAEQEGVATCWIAAFDPAKLRAALSLEEGQEVFALTPLGYPPAGFQRKGVKERKALGEIVRFL